MWRGYPQALATYYNACLQAFEDRGYRNVTMKRIPVANCALPEWFGNTMLHSSHRQTLLSKKFDWYSQFGWKEQPIYQYYWPR